MGPVLSHYTAIKDLLWESKVVRRDRSDTDNPFRWDKIRLNLPGDPSYSPTILWMSKVWGGTQDLDADFTTYMDDYIVAAGSEKEACRSARRVGTIWKQLGLQYSPRKRSMAGQDVGSWIGTKVHIIYGSIYQLMGEEKWSKTRIIIKKWLQRVILGEPLDCKELKSNQGLLNYVFDTYRSCRPFLKGMYLNLDSWSPHREYEAWKLDPDGMNSDLLEDNLGGKSEEALRKITGLPRKGDSAEKG